MLNFPGRTRAKIIMTAGQLCGHMHSIRKMCCISFYCNRKKPTSKSKHHFLPKDIINIFKMAWGNLSNTRQISKCGQKGSVPFQEFSVPAPLSISWLKFITYIYLHTLLSLVCFQLGGTSRAQSCTLHITIFGEKRFPKSPTEVSLPSKTKQRGFPLTVILPQNTRVGPEPRSSLTIANNIWLSEILSSDLKVGALSLQRGSSGGEKADCKMNGVNVFLFFPALRVCKKSWSRQQAETRLRTPKVVDIQGISSWCVGQKPWHQCFHHRQLCLKWQFAERQASTAVLLAGTKGAHQHVGLHCVSSSAPAQTRKLWDLWHDLQHFVAQSRVY